MITCPNDQEFRDLIANALPEDSVQQIDLHLSRCATCQARLESLANVEQLSTLCSENKVRAEVSPSLFLQNVMQELQGDLTHHDNNSQRISTTLPELPPASSPNAIGRLAEFEVIRVIGRGGMGVVFHALDTVLNRSVAIKVLSPHLLHDAEAKNRFIREAQAAATVEHENVVAIYQIHASERMPYLVFQYIEGESLASRLERERKLPFEEVVQIGLQIAQGLHSAHSRGLIHRDIKPGNVLVDGAGVVRITDFGLAKHAGMETLTAIGTLAGTPAYMSPEQASGQPLDARSDLFSLGVLLYRAAAGILPFQGDSPFVVLDKIRQAEEKPLQELNPELPAWFCQIVHRLLRKNPDERISTASELAEQLLKRETREVPKTRSWRGPLIAFLSLALIVVAVVVFRRNDPDPQPVERPPFQDFIGFKILSTETEHLTLADAMEKVEDGGTILIYGNGPFICPPLKATKRMTIRAAPGYQPQFAPVPGQIGPFLSTAYDLRIEGLDINWPTALQPFNPEDNSSRGVVLSTAGKLSVSYCRIVSYALNPCIGASGEELVVDHCRLIGKGAWCISWKPTGGVVRIEQNTIEGDKMFVMHHPNFSNFPKFLKQPKGHAVSIRQNVVNAEQMIAFFYLNRPNRTFSYDVSDNIIHCNTLLTIFTVAKISQLVDGQDAMLSTMKSMLLWNESANVYSGVNQYLNANKDGKVFVFQQAGLRTMAQWHQTWNITTSRSVEANVTFEKENEILKPVLGNIESNAIDPSLVGPGTPYHTRP